MNRIASHFKSLSAIEAHDRPGLQAKSITRFERAQDVRRVSAAGERHQNIAWGCQHLELPRKNILIARIVRQTHEHRSVGRERMGTNPTTTSLCGSVDQVVRPMVGIRRTAAVSTQKNPSLIGSDFIDLQSQLTSRGVGILSKGQGHFFKILG